MSQDDVVLRNFLLQSGLVSRSQLSALPDDASLAKMLVERGMLGEDEVRRATSHALGVPFIELSHHDISVDAMLLIPEPLARAANAVAYKLGDGSIEVAVLDLSDIEQLAQLQQTHRILPRLTTKESMRKALLHYQKHLKEKFGEMFGTGVQAAEALIKHALYSRAGGVHIDAGTMGTLVRYQIDHAMHEAFSLSEHVGKTLVTQIKSLAKLLPVARPQEGKFSIELGPHSAEASRGKETIHVRVHSIPTVNGDKLLLRLARAHQGQRGYTLESLGFHGSGLDEIHRMLAHRKGLLAVEGAPGAGTTTLLYTLVDLLSTPHMNVASVEHKVTTRLPHVAQVEVSSAVSFGAALRATLKQDPNIVMIDSVSDTDTAAVASAAARRGTLVVAGVTAGQEVSADITIGIALVRRLCTKQFAHISKLSRHESDTLSQAADFAKVLAALKEEGIIEGTVPWKDIQFARATPCSECHSGYQGYIGLSDVRDSSSLALTIVEDGLFKAAQGLTSVEEVLSLLN